MPQVNFLNLTQDMNWSLDRSEYYTFEKTGDISNRGTLVLPKDMDKNMKHFRIPTWGIPILIKH
ncbi:MAG: hypothetical protein IBJ00_06360 [Alphaproteobacteria bacterium]|nr:hypothetical protein [Alphaproteobacteria bacterium]